PDALLPEKDEIVRYGLDRRGEDFRDAERVGVTGVAIDVESLRCATSKALPQRLRSSIGAKRHDGDIATLRLPGLDRLFEPELVVGRDDELDPRLVDALFV